MPDVPYDNSPAGLLNRAAVIERIELKILKTVIVAYFMGWLSAALTVALSWKYVWEFSW